MTHFGQQNVEEVPARRLNIFSFNMGAFGCNVSGISTLIPPCYQKTKRVMWRKRGHMKELWRPQIRE